MILEPSAADAVKAAIDAEYRLWRQIGISCIPSESTETPPIILIVLDGVIHAVAAGSNNAVFGGGHLALAHMWVPDRTGCTVVGHESLLEATGVRELPGFVHFHRLGHFQCTTDESPEMEARIYFRDHQPEYCAFFAVTFRRDPSETRFPWRAFRRDLPAST